MFQKNTLVVLVLSAVSMLGTNATPALSIDGDANANISVGASGNTTANAAITCATSEVTGFSFKDCELLSSDFLPNQFFLFTRDIMLGKVFCLRCTRLTPAAHFCIFWKIQVLRRFSSKSCRRKGTFREQYFSKL